MFALGVWYNFDRRNEPRSSAEIETTLTKIKNLERIYIAGFGDDFMDRALDKLLAQRRTKDEASLRVLQADLAELEQRYAMRSDEFTQRYQNGVMGDAADFVEWNALYQMLTKVQHRLSLLQG